jgi:hypothetical protein
MQYEMEMSIDYFDSAVQFIQKLGGFSQHIHFMRMRLAFRNKNSRNILKYEVVFVFVQIFFSFHDKTTRSSSEHIGRREFRLTCGGEGAPEHHAELRGNGLPGRENFLAKRRWKRFLRRSKKER